MQTTFLLLASTLFERVFLFIALCALAFFAFLFVVGWILDALDGSAGGDTLPPANNPPKPRPAPKKPRPSPSQDEDARLKQRAAEREKALQQEAKARAVELARAAEMEALEQQRQLDTFLAEQAETLRLNTQSAEPVRERLLPQRTKGYLDDK